MPALPLVIAPDPIFKKKAASVGAVTNDTRKIMDDMLATLEYEHGVGMAATMVGILKRIVVINLTDEGQAIRLFMADPEIISSSKETQMFLEASLCFPGISSDVVRPKNITVKYLDYNGKQQELAATGFLGTCIQHEIDYLNGKVFLDYLSPLKRDTLLRKMKKFVKGHTCSSSCAH